MFMSNIYVFKFYFQRLKNNLQLYWNKQLSEIQFSPFEVARIVPALFTWLLLLLLL